MIGGKVNGGAEVTRRLVSMREIRRELRAAIEGNAPWNVRLGYGGFVFFDFGERRKVANGPDEAADCLWIYCSSWRLFGAVDGDVASADGDDPALIAALQSCIGCTVTRIGFDSDLNLSLHFEEAAMTFRTLRSFTTADAWTLYRGSTNYSLQGDGTVERETSTTQLR